MKKLITITMLMALAISGFAQQYNFSAVCESGQTLYYRITDAEAHTVILTHPFSENNLWFQGNYYEGHVKPAGEIIIPSVVTYNGTDYTVTAIDSNTFFECDITSVFIPNSVIDIIPEAFRFSASLESITVDEENPMFYSESNALIRRADMALVAGCKATTIPDGIETICVSAFAGAGDGGDLVIPNSVKTIEDFAFHYCEFSGSLTLSDSLETIGIMAFYLSHFTGSLTIPNLVTEIKHHTFFMCQFTGDLTLSSSLVTVDTCAFTNTPFTGTLTIPNSMNFIGVVAFGGTKFSELDLGKSVVTIAEDAFRGCDQLSGVLRLPASLTEIDQWAFKWTSFDEIYSPNRIPPTLASNAFEGYNADTPIHIPFGYTEVYQNTPGWNYFSNFIEEEPIIYRDFEPDSILIYWEKLGPVWIDLDVDGEADDLKLRMVAGGNICYPEIVVGDNSSIRICHVEPYQILSEVEEENWTTYIGWSGGSMAARYSNYGFRIQREDGYYYGWFETYNRVVGKNEKQIAHFGFDRTAYCTIPNYPLRWGQTEIEITPTIVPNLYTIGYKDENTTTRTALLFKNNELLHSISIDNKQITPHKMASDSEGNIYWMVVYSENESTLQTEIWKNDELYVSTEGHNGVSINDLYCLDDTLFYVGNTTASNGKMVATVWRGPDFTPYWILGDGVFNSTIYDADVDESTNTPYYCGYVTQGLDKAIVWKASQRLFTLEPYQYANYTKCNSQAKEISVCDGIVHSIGHFYLDYRSSMEYHPCIWCISETGTTTWMAQPSESINALCSYGGNSYFCDNWPEKERYSVCRNYSDYQVFAFPYPYDNKTEVKNIRRGFDDFYMVGKLNGQGCIWKNFALFSQYNNCDMIMDIVAVDSTTFLFNGAEWYYEIQNPNGSITYQHLQCVGDTLFEGGKRPKIIIRSNTQYDKDFHTEVTHEYIYEENGKMYWWNKDLQEFTTLYDLTADTGDEWEIKVGDESLIMHVDAVEYIEYEGEVYRMLRVSDPNDFFSGDIVCGIGHLTSFFPERLMDRGKSYRVEGMRCYWVDGELVFKLGDKDCDEVYEQLHNGIGEDGPSTGSGTLMVYPNPTNGILFVRLPQCDSPTTDKTEYRITNLTGQTLLHGNINAENQQIDISALPSGMYFITVGEATRKFVVK